jgi:hypothetical protein
VVKHSKYQMNPRTLLLATILSLVVSLSVLLTLSIVDQAYAQSRIYEAPLSGKNEVPPVQSNATGLAEFTAPFNNTVKYRVNVTGIFNPTAAHIHVAQAGENGEIVADLFNTPTSKENESPTGIIFRGNFSASSLKGTMQGRTLEDLAAAMDSGEIYVNVHTAEHPDGEIRGQIINTEKTAGSTN